MFDNNIKNEFSNTGNIHVGSLFRKTAERYSAYKAVLQEIPVQECHVIYVGKKIHYKKFISLIRFSHNDSEFNPENNRVIFCDVTNPTNYKRFGSVSEELDFYSELLAGITGNINYILIIRNAEEIFLKRTGKIDLTGFEEGFQNLSGSARLILLTEYNVKTIDPGLFKEIILIHPGIYKNGEIYNNFFYGPARFLLKKQSRKQAVEGFECLLEFYKEKTQKLQNLEENYKILFKASREGIITVNSKGVILSANKAALTILEYENELELIGKYAYTLLVKPENRMVILSVLKEAGYMDNLEMEFRKSDGNRIEVLTSIIQNRNVLRQDIKTVIVFRDITHRKLYEQELKESKAMLDEAQRIASIGSFAWDIKTDIITWSDELFRLIGLEPVKTKIYLQDFTRFVHPDDYMDLEQAIITAIQTGNPVDFTFRVIRIDGIIRYVHIKGKVEMSRSGKPFRIVGTGHDITEQKLAEEELKRSKNQLEELAANIPGVIFQILREADGRLKFVYIHEKLETEYGISVQDMLKNFESAIKQIHPDDIPEVYRSIRSSAATLQTEFLEIRLRKQSGNYVWLRITSSPQLLDSGQILWNAVAIDITAKKQTDSALDALFESSTEPYNKDYFQKISENLKTWLGVDWIFIGKVENDKKISIVGGESALLTIPEQFYNITGTPTEFIMKNGFTVIPENVTGRFPDDPGLQELQASGYVGIPLINKQGRSFGVLCAFSRGSLQLPDRVEEVMHIAASKIASELERKMYADALLKEQASLEAMLEQQKLFNRIQTYFNSGETFSSAVEKMIPDIKSVMMIDNFHICLNDEQFAGIFKIEQTEPTEEMNQENVFCNAACLPGDFSLPEGRNTFGSLLELGKREQTFFQSRNVGSAVILPIVLRAKECGYLIASRRNPSQWMQNSVESFKVITEIILQALVRFNHFYAMIDAGKKHTQAVRLAERSSRLASLGTLAAGIAHEINQPLNAIKVTVDEILYFNEINQEIPKNEVYQNLHFVSEQAVKIDNIIKHMRVLARQEKPHKSKPMNLNNVVKTALSLINKQLSAHSINVKLSLNAELPGSFGHDVQMEQVILNLVINSMHALDTVDGRKKFIAISTGVGNGSCIIKVSDNGPGIEKKVLKDIFDPFFSTKADKKGFGLGLSIAESIISSFGGTISAVNNPVHGVTFTVMLPRV